jgi:hypothetical protein
MVVQLAVLTVISELYRSGIDQLQEVWVKVSLTIYWHLFFFIRTCVPRVPKMINNIFTIHLHLSDGKSLSLQQETRPYDSGFRLGFCNSTISNLMERDPNCKYAAEKETVLVYLWFNWKFHMGTGLILVVLFDGWVNAKEGSNLSSQLVARK